MTRPRVAAPAAAVALLVAATAATGSYGGRPVPADEAGSLAHYTVQEGLSEGECSGVFITPRHVLTAAHCVRAERRGVRVTVVGRRVRAGNPGRRAHDAAIVRVAVHPAYVAANPQAGHDLAVLTLARPIGVPLPMVTAREEASLVVSGTQAGVMGFGVTRPGQGYTERRARVIRLEVLEPYNCVTPQLVGAFARSQLCAASGDQGVCAGDSGGPMVVRAADGTRRVAGITTLALEEVACRNVVGMFARVAAMRRWVETQVGRATLEDPPSDPPPAARR